MEFQNSASREKAVAAQEEINKMRVQRRKLSKKLKRSQK